MKQYVVFVDTKPARGGGQVVLENLLAGVDPSRVGILTSQNLARLLKVEQAIARWTSLRELYVALDELKPNPVRVVANATSDFARGLAVVRGLSRRGYSVSSTAVVHSYPKNHLRSVAVRQLLRHFDQAVVVEPGLLRFAPGAVTSPWLGVSDQDAAQVPLPDGSKIRPGAVKALARPDRTKGLHHLPAIFSALSADGFECYVSLGDALEADGRYTSGLHRKLSPWLVDGSRSADWLRPGDLLVVPSVSGEAACLTAQEAMLRGATVVASRLGLMPYLAPAVGGVRTFASGDTGQAVAAVRELLHLSSEDYARACLANAELARCRAGLWYSHVRGFLFDR